MDKKIGDESCRLKGVIANPGDKPYKGCNRYKKCECVLI